MIINGYNLPNIGFIRAKPVGDGKHYTLSIYPSGAGPFDGTGGATMLETDVSASEVQRIQCVAPHLLNGGWGWKPS